MAIPGLSARHLLSAGIFGRDGSARLRSRNGGRRRLGICVGRLQLAAAAMSMSISTEIPISTTTSTAATMQSNIRAARGTGSTAPNIAKGSHTGTRQPDRSTTGHQRMKPSSPGKIPVDVPKPAGRIWPAEALTRSGAARMPASAAALRAGRQPGRPGAGICPVREAAPFQAWTEAAARHVMPAIAAVPAVRACHPAAGVAAA